MSRAIAMAVVGALILGTMAAPAAAQPTAASYTQPYQRKALEIYRTIIGMRTAEGQGLVPAMADYLAGQFRSGGFPTADVHVLPLTLPSGEKTAGLVVRYRGDGSSGRKPILLLAHMDVVDARREDWSRDPFTLGEERGYFFGRGTADDKFGVASLTATFLRLRAEGFVPTRDLVIAFSGDEETGMLSARDLVTKHRALTDAEFALNDDGGGGKLDEAGMPVAYFIQTAEKTYATFELTIANPGGHSSTPRTDNAIFDLAHVLARLEAHRFPVAVNDATRAYLREMGRLTPGLEGEAMARLATDPTDRAAADELWRHPEAVGITRTTCVPTLLRAGHAENALPQSATVTVNCRIFPGETVDAVKATLERVADLKGLTITQLGEAFPSPASPLRDDVIAAVTAAVHVRYPAIPIVPYMAPYATDGREVRSAGIPTYGVMGLFMKDSDQFSHGRDERVAVEQLFGALEHWKELLTRLAGNQAREAR
jgi:acetylornithine deacetylase/succinyl-diaminopimelate desuccinylase-like protein